MDRQLPQVTVSSWASDVKKMKSCIPTKKFILYSGATADKAAYNFAAAWARSSQAENKGVEGLNVTPDGAQAEALYIYTGSQCLSVSLSAAYTH